MNYLDYSISFISGYVYGLCNVIVGQPLDTIKTRLQTIQNNDNIKKLNSFSIGKEIYKNEGIRGLYRGGCTLVIGGGLIRSAQFGVNNIVIIKLREKYGITKEEDKYFKIFDPQVVGIIMIIIIIIIIFIFIIIIIIINQLLVFVVLL
jgi:hypothetical protein